MLKKVNFPLTNAQISDLMLSRRIHHLFSSSGGPDRNDRYRSHPEGNQQSYDLLPHDRSGKARRWNISDEIPPEIRREVSNYLVLHSYELRSDSSTIADYYLTSDHNYTVNCMVKEGKQTLIELKFTVPTEEAAHDPGG